MAGAVFSVKPSGSEWIRSCVSGFTACFSPTATLSADLPGCPLGRMDTIKAQIKEIYARDVGRQRTGEHHLSGMVLGPPVGDQFGEAGGWPGPHCGCHSQARRGVVDRRRPRCGGTARGVVGIGRGPRPLHCGSSDSGATREILGGRPARCWPSRCDSRLVIAGSVLDQADLSCLSILRSPRQVCSTTHRCRVRRFAERRTAEHHYRDPRDTVSRHRHGPCVAWAANCRREVLPVPRRGLILQPLQPEQFVDGDNKRPG